jgi:hypothetical protein
VAEVWTQGFILSNQASPSWATPPAHFALVILEMRSWELFVQAGLKLLSQPPKEIGLKVWASGTQVLPSFLSSLGIELDARQGLYFSSSSSSFSQSIHKHCYKKIAVWNACSPFPLPAFHLNCYCLQQQFSKCGERTGRLLMRSELFPNKTKILIEGQWLTPVILATWEVESGRIMIWGY